MNEFSNDHYYFHHCAYHVPSSLFFTLVALIFVISPARDLIMTYFLLRKGQASQGTVLKLERVRSASYCEYEYAVESGTKLTGRSWISPREQKTLDVGSIVTVVYNPAKSSQSILYPSTAFLVANA